MGILCSPLSSKTLLYMGQRLCVTGISEQGAMFVHGSVQPAIASPCAAEKSEGQRMILNQTKGLSHAITINADQVRSSAISGQRQDNCFSASLEWEFGCSIW